MRTMSASELIVGQRMRRLIIVFLMLSLMGCTAMLLGGGQSDQSQQDCDDYPDQAHCE